MLRRAGRSPKREQNKTDEDRWGHGRQQDRDNLEVHRRRVLKQKWNERAKTQTDNNKNPINDWNTRLFRAHVRLDYPARLVKYDQYEHGNDRNHGEPSCFLLIVHGPTVFEFNRRLTTRLSRGQDANWAGYQLQCLARWRRGAIRYFFVHRLRSK